MTTLDANQTLFRSEYELELETWLRRRFRGVCICYIVLTAVIVIIRALVIGASNDGRGRIPALIITGLAGAASMGTLAHLLFARRWTDATRPQLLRAASLLIWVLGGISVVKALVIEQFRAESEYLLMPLFFWHFIACLFLPWTPRESLKPILPLLGAWMLIVLLRHGEMDITRRLLTVVFGPIILLPGLGICALRLKSHSESFRVRMVGQHFLTMRQEFSKARSIHESMFPKPHDDGFVKFEYTYTPMRELGGDYVHLHVSEEGLVHLTLLDVTGHGLPAALTVNRLFGELERIRGEAPLAEPGEVLSLLNRYVHLTMTKHNIFVTALCVTLDPQLGRLHWANAGHPPAFLRGANGVVTQLPATSVLLGALDHRDFIADAKTTELAPGDTIVVYTDGAFEARDRAGKQLGLARLKQLLHSQPPPRHWPQFIAQAVQRHSAGRNEDDILIASVTFAAPRPQPVTTRMAQAMS
jgi:hypothetical protein